MGESLRPPFFLLARSLIPSLQLLVDFYTPVWISLAVNLATVLIFFAVARKGSPTPSRLFGTAMFFPLKSSYVIYARMTSELLALASVAVYLWVASSDGEISLSERAGIAVASFLESTANFRGTAFASVGSSVALLFAAGVIPSFGDSEEWSNRCMWLWFPAIHVAVFHCCVRLYLLKA